jgi:hypothetical protein
VGILRRAISVSISSLEEHPNLTEILGVLAQVPHITDGDVASLARAWHNTIYVADARGRALAPESPLVTEVLAAFEAVQSLFAEDLAGDRSYVTLDPKITSIALKATRDAIAAAYARPILTRGEHAALMRAWRSVFPTQNFEEPDLGPRAAEVKALLTAMPLLAQRCHDADAPATFESLLRTAWTMDDDMRETARRETWAAAVLTSRRRVWTLVRRSGTEALGRFCPTCRHAPADEDTARVLALCLDAACALLVADAVDDNLTDVLTMPIEQLVPAQRPSIDEL